jgi:hypothetical protein
MDMEATTESPPLNSKRPNAGCGVADQVVLPRVQFVESKLVALEKETLTSMRQLERLEAITENHKAHLKRLDDVISTGQREATEHRRAAHEEMQRIYHRVDALDQSVSARLDKWDLQLNAWGTSFASHVTEMRLAVLEGGKQAVEAEQRRIDAHNLMMKNQERSIDWASKMWRAALGLSAAIGGVVVIGGGIYSVLVGESPGSVLTGLLRSMFGMTDGG